MRRFFERLGPVLSRFKFVRKIRKQFLLKLVWAHRHDFSRIFEAEERLKEKKDYVAVIFECCVLRKFPILSPSGWKSS